ncbi:MAG: hypothetical protein CL878_10820 [Dehalococcoidia bacterium]|nr:hypothetical protein [Dehalococcoidia bacterium]
MELREYWHIIWSRRLVIGTLLLVTFVASIGLTYGRPVAYESVMRILIKPILPSVPDSGYYSREYYRTLFAEYIQDDLSEVIKSRQFAEDINEVIETRHGEALDVEDIATAFGTRKEHRVVRITIITPSLRYTEWIGEAATELLQTVGWQYVSPGGRRQVDVEVIDPPQDPDAPTLLRRFLTVVLHVSVALAVGLVLAFLLDTFDDRIRTSDEIEHDLGWAVLAAVPTGRPADLPSI